MNCKIPFTKDIDFEKKVSEITSISLEHEIKVEDGLLKGNFIVSGDFKSHEVSVNVLPFSFKIPFTIEIPDHLDRDSITIEISDFAYDMVEDSKIKVNIELELEGEEQEVVEEEIEEEKPEVDSEEILKMLEETKEKEDSSFDEERNHEEEEEKTEEEQEEEKPEGELEEKESAIAKEDVRDQNLKESEEMIIANTQTEEEYTTYHIHMIKEGETVETICTMYNSNLALLGEYNDLTNITPGEKLIIPSDNE